MIADETKLNKFWVGLVEVKQIRINHPIYIILHLVILDDRLLRYLILFE